MNVPTPSRFHFYIFLIAGGLMVATPLFCSAATVTWIATSTSNWNTSSSWSSGIVPTANDTALFSASSTANVSITATMSVGGVVINSGYTGTITQSAFSNITVGSSGWTQSGGTFVGESTNTNNNINLNGPFVLNNGDTFTSTEGNLNLNASSTFSGTFNAASGTVIFASSTPSVITGSSTLDNLDFGVGQCNQVNETIATGTVITVQGMITFSMCATLNLSGGEIDAQGNIMTSGDNMGDTTSTTTFVMNGTGNQVITGGGSPTGPELILPNLTITKNSGNVTLNNLVVVEGSWTNTNATAINPGTSTVILGFQIHAGAAANYALTMTGSSTFNNLYFATTGQYGGNLAVTVATGTVLTTNGDLELEEDGGAINLDGGGTFDVQGNIDGGFSDFGIDASGTAAVVMDGTSTQILDGYALTATPALHLPNLTINKASGSIVIGGVPSTQGLHLSSEFGTFIEGNWNNVNGTPIIPTSTNAFVDFMSCTAATGTSYNSFTLNGSSTFGELVLGGEECGVGNNSLFTIATNTVVTAKGDLNFAYYGGWENFAGGGEIDVQGNIDNDICNNAGTPTTSSSFPIVLDGTGTQLVGITFATPTPCTGLFPGSVFLPNLTVKKPSGVAAVSGDLSPGPEILGNLSINQGELDVATGTAAVTFRVDGTTTVSSGAVLGGYPLATTTLTLGSSVINSGTVSFNNTGNCTSSLPDYLRLRSTSSGHARGWSGSGIFVIENTDIKDQSASSTIYAYASNNSGDANGFSFVSCPTFSEGDYRFYAAASSSNPTTPLATEDIAPILTATSSPIRVRLNVEIPTVPLQPTMQAFKLQYAVNGTSSFADVTATSSLSFYNQSPLTDGSTLASALLSTSNAAESFDESNPTPTNPAIIGANQLGEWDFSLNPSELTNNNYYLRLVTATGTVLASYNNYPFFTVDVPTPTPIPTPTPTPSASVGTTGGAAKGGFSGFVTVSLVQTSPSVFAARTSDDGRVTEIYFTLDNAKISNPIMVPPYSTAIDPATLASGGVHTVQAFATDQHGDVAASNVLIVNAAAGAATTTIPFAPFYYFSRNLAFGSHSLDVLTLQTLLNDLGFSVASAGPGSPGSETDFFGPLTEAAVQRFQAAYDIVTDGTPKTTGYGLVGPKTRAELNLL